MTGFKSYFSAHARSNFKPLIYIVIIVLSLSFIMGITGQPYEEWDHAAGALIKDYHATLYVPVLFMCVLCYVLPVMEFSFFKKRRNLDCAYALPISRRAMGLVHYLWGAITLIGTFTLSYLTNFILLLSRGVEYFNFPPMIGHYFLCVLLGLALYSIMVFVFNDANTASDGIWFMLLWSFVFILAIAAIETVTDNWRIFEADYCAIPWGTVDLMTTTYQYIVEKNNLEFATFWQKPECIIWLVAWLLIGIAAAVGSYLTFGKRRMEKTEEISDSFLGFRVLIPVYAITGMLAFASIGVIFWVIIEMLAFVGYTIYRRGFHYKKSDLIILAAMLVFLFLV